MSKKSDLGHGTGYGIGILTKEQWQTVQDNKGLAYYLIQKCYVDNHLLDEYFFNVGLPALVRCIRNHDPKKAKLSAFLTISIQRDVNKYRISKHKKKMASLNSILGNKELIYMVQEVDDITAEDRLIYKETTNRLNEEIDKLPDDLQFIINHVYWKNTKHEDIGKILGCSKQTIKRKAAKARLILKVKLLNL